ncbi:hypothetical protein KCU93_g224, partial [Aureobasidium melanogenum]
MSAHHWLGATDLNNHRVASQANKNYETAKRREIKISTCQSGLLVNSNICQSAPQISVAGLSNKATTRTTTIDKADEHLLWAHRGKHLFEFDSNVFAVGSISF